MQHPVRLVAAGSLIDCTESIDCLVQILVFIVLENMLWEIVRTVRSRSDGSVAANTGVQSAIPTLAFRINFEALFSRDLGHAAHASLSSPAEVTGLLHEVLGTRCS